MRFYIRYLFGFILMLSGQFVFSSDDFYWQAANPNSFPGKFSSATSACNAFISAGERLSYQPLFTSDIQYNCRHKLRITPTKWGDSVYAFNFIRYGTCSEPSTYNPVTGECEAPPKNECEEKAGDSDFFSKSGDMDDGYTSIITVGGKKWVAAPQDGCMGGCKVSVTTDCKNRIGTNSYRCSGPATYTGESCTATDGSPQLEQEENYRSEEPSNIEKKEPCVYVTDAEGRSVCVSKASLDKEGQNCGTYNGETLCRPKEATLDEKTVETEVTETTKPDGGKQIVKKDVATETKCTGSKKSCTTTTTTTTTTTNSDGSGTTTSTEVECKGANCGSGVGGGGAGSGSGEGEEGEEGGELEGQDEVAGFGESIQDFNSRISGAPILASVSSISMPRGGSCSMGSASVPLLGSISFNWVCQNANLLDPLYYVMLAVWAIAAVRVFLEA